MSWVLGVDPGRSKAGYAVVAADGGVLTRGVEALEALPSRLEAVLALHRVHAIALGSGTNARRVRALLERFNLPIHWVDGLRRAGRHGASTSRSIPRGDGDGSCRSACSYRDGRSTTMLQSQLPVASLPGVSAAFLQANMGNFPSMEGTVRRIWGVVTGTAVAVLMAYATAQAALAVNGTPRYDFASALMLSVFGETTDASASFFAQNGDRTSESPLRELALRVTPPVHSLTSQMAFVAPAIMPQARLSLSSLDDDATALSRAAQEGLVPSGGYAPALSAGSAQQITPLTLSDTPTYRPLPPTPSLSPAAGTFAFEAPALEEEQNAGTPALQPDAPLTLSADASNVSAPAFDAPSDALPNLALNDRAALNGSLAMPELHRVTFNVNEDAQHPSGYDAMLGVSNLSPTPSLYAGKLTYTIPGAFEHAVRLRLSGAFGAERSAAQRLHHQRRDG